MININVDFKNTCGKINAVNSLNNGPVGSSVRNTQSSVFAELEIPYSRLHDSSFNDSYGGEHTVDVHRIFKDFDADENDPASYLFGPTDEYIASIIAAGSKPFYRLGASIEHGHKVGTQVPKDFAKWARICEHIIMHYNEGWADGFRYNIENWEIWNEPECMNADGSKPCWQGTDEQFVDFYEVVAKHLKSQFPNLKIGGPAFYSTWRTPFREAFVKAVKEREIPLDFFSFHIYIRRPEMIETQVKEARKLLSEYGLGDIELVLSEWNYVRAWGGCDFRYSIKAINGLKGAAIAAGGMCAAQASGISKMMYYEGRPGAWAGIYDQFSEPQKAYYSFIFFKELRRLGTWVKTDYRYDNIYVCAATDGKDGAILVTNYSEHDSDFSRKVIFDIENLFKPMTRVQIYKIGKENDGELIYDEPYFDEKPQIRLEIGLFETYLIKIIPEDCGK